MKVLVTGAGGFVGSAVAKAAAAHGDDVIALVRRPLAPERDFSCEHLRYIVADLADSAAIMNLIAEQQPDAVVHSAWGGLHGDERQNRAQIELNLLPSLALADAALANGVECLVGIGSQAEYGQFHGRVSEKAMPAPISMYGAAKLAAFHLIGARCFDTPLRFAWLRLFAAYGEGDNPRWLIPTVVRTLRERRAPELTAGTQMWDYLYIDDVAAAVMRVIHEPGAVGVFNLSSDDPVAVRAVVERLRDMLAPGLPLSFGSIPFGPHQIMHMQGDNRRLREATGWYPRVSLSDGLARTVAAAA